jgi:hypothetical protein
MPVRVFLVESRTVDSRELAFFAVLTEAEARASIPVKDGPSAPPMCIGSSAAVTCAAAHSAQEASGAEQVHLAGKEAVKALRDTTVPGRRKVTGISMIDTSTALWQALYMGSCHESSSLRQSVCSALM